MFDLDVLACPSCGGRLRVLATVEDPRAVQMVLLAPICPSLLPALRGYDAGEPMSL